MVIDPGLSTEEKVFVGARTSGSLSSVTRGVDGTLAASHDSGATCYPVFTAVDADEANDLASTMTTKGDLISTDGTDPARLAVGTNNDRLVAASGETTGLKWVADTQNTVIDAKGDLLVGSAADTVARLAVDTTDGAVLIADSTATNGVSWQAQNTGVRNILYNGAMQVAQRGTSTASLTSNGYRTADRWKIGIVTQGTWTNSVENDAPTGSGFGKSLKVLCTTIDGSPTGSDEVVVDQRLEGQDLQAIRKGTSSAQQLTISFWAKANLTGTYIVMLYDLDNTRFCSKSYTISASGTWEFKTLTFPADTTGAFDNDNSGSLLVRFFLGAGPNFTSGTLQTTWGSDTAGNRAVGQVNLAATANNYWQVTGVQLNVGGVAAPFEFKSFERELRECQRYYQRFTASTAYGAFGYGLFSQSTNAACFVNLVTPMRASPATANTSYANIAPGDNYNAPLTPSALSVVHNSTMIVAMNLTVTGATQYRPAILQANNNSAGYIAFDVEL
jgi:hypothetical protein